MENFDKLTAGKSIAQLNVMLHNLTEKGESINSPVCTHILNEIKKLKDKDVKILADGKLFTDWMSLDKYVSTHGLQYDKTDEINKNQFVVTLKYK